MCFMLFKGEIKEHTDIHTKTKTSTQKSIESFKKKYCFILVFVIPLSSTLSDPHSYKTSIYVTYVTCAGNSRNRTENNIVKVC